MAGGASYPQFAIVVLHLRTVPSSAARCFAPADFASLRVLGASAASRPPISHRAVFGGPVFRPCGLRFAPCPQFAMVVLLRLAACSTPLLIGLTTACFAHCARPSCAPLAAPSLSPSLGSSYRPALRWPGIPGLRTPFGRVLAPPPLRGFDGYGLFRALRAAFVRFLNSRWSSCCAWRLAILPCSLGLLRPVSRTARGLRAPPPYTPPGTIIPRKGFRFAQFPCRAAISPSPRVGGKAAFDTDQMPDLYEENEKNHSHATFHRKVHLGYRRD